MLWLEWLELFTERETVDSEATNLGKGDVHRSDGDNGTLNKTG